MHESERDAQRVSRLEMNGQQFRELGYQLVDRIATFLDSLPDRSVTSGESPAQIRQTLGAQRTLPQHGADPSALLTNAADLLFDHSLFNAHPRFWGYVTSSAAPIGILGDLLASAVNPNMGLWSLSPMASEVEAQTVRWIAEMLHYPADCGGLFVSGGNMANFVCFFAARQAKAGRDVRKLGVEGTRLRVYCSTETHTWMQKAADLSGLGTDAVRWIAVDSEGCIDLRALRDQIKKDIDAGGRPILVAGNAGTVSTGAVDPLPELAQLCREFDLWFHVDGAYGGFAAVVPDAPLALAGLSEADSIAVDPHKWLYAPLEAGCALVRDLQKLRDAFSYHPPYYHLGDEVINYFDLGPQNSRGFRALKVWLALQQVGREGYVQMISEDIRLAGELFAHIPQFPELEALTLSLSIATFRFVPKGLDSGSAEIEAYLDQLNRELLTRLQASGEAYLSNGIVRGKFALRACIVNFRTSVKDVHALLPLVVRIGREMDATLRPQNLCGQGSVIG
ncbi:MAG TPA: aminotransferase class V-fold PLP-dependent enzyme [Terracidiphilus sp.]|nr:aminotransferase class V-fold PLP-dependent enzyme [Terracidiphilus sp.]